MKLTLEKDDLIKLLSLALGYEIRPDEVDVCADPFEVRLNQVRLREMVAPPKQDTLRVQEEPPVVSPPARNVSSTVSTPIKPPTLSYTEAVLEDSNELENLQKEHALSEQLAKGAYHLPSTYLDPDSHAGGKNAFSRPLAPNESEEPPGADYESEIR